MVPLLSDSVQSHMNQGKVYLVGAGPGDPNLLTIEAFNLLARAEVVFHDDMVSPEVLALIPKNALVESVGKRCGHAKVTQQQIHSLLIEAAQQGRTVIRLKSGDPLIFGRAGEELEALRSAGIECVIAPGITAASGAAARRHSADGSAAGLAPRVPKQPSVCQQTIVRLERGRISRHDDPGLYARLRL